MHSSSGEYDASELCYGCITSCCIWVQMHTYVLGNTQLYIALDIYMKINVYFKSLNIVPCFVT